MDMEIFDIFISYSRKDSSIANTIYKLLKRLDLNPYIDNKMHTGTHFPKELATKIRNSHILLFLGSENSYQSSWTEDEILYARKKEKIIVPYMIDESEIPENFDFILSSTNQKSVKDCTTEELVKELKEILDEKRGNDKKRNPNPPITSFKKGQSVEFEVNNTKFNMLPVKCGRFLMGTNIKCNAYPQHEVQIEKDYFIGETPVTQSLWQSVMGNNPSYFKGDDKPVENISWKDCRLFMQRLNKMTNHNFRFPTEAEWEYAARARQDYHHSGSYDILNVAWFNENSNNETKTVKQKLKNNLGIYDMNGNVKEWCLDKYIDYNRPINPNSHNIYRVIRGGCYYDNEAKCTVYMRDKASEETHDNGIGLRLTLTYGE